MNTDQALMSVPEDSKSELFVNAASENIVWQGRSDLWERMKSCKEEEKEEEEL